MKKVSVLLVSIAMLLFVENASATVLTFDDLSPLDSDGGVAPIGSYGGLNWSGFFYYKNTTNENPSGYVNGVVSPSYVALNISEADVSVSDGPFNFIGAYLTGAWNDGLNITVEGWLSGTQKYATTVVVDTTGPTWFDFNYMNIDTLNFSSFGGTAHGYPVSGGTHFVMDNFTFNQVPDNQVPEPATFVLLSTGLAGVVLLRKRFKS